MAIWQFKVLVIPEPALIKKFGTIPVSVTRDLVEGIDWWAESHLVESVEGIISSVLPERKSWSRSMRIWGEERSDCMLILYHDENKHKIQEIEFRFDVRKVSLPFVHRATEFAKRFQCVFIPRSYHVIAPDELLVLAEIEKSTAKKYVQNPISTVVNLKSEQAEVIPFPKKIDKK